MSQAPNLECDDATPTKIDLIGLDQGEFAAVALDLGLPAWRGKQLWSWVYHHKAVDFGDMTNLAKDVRADLGHRYRVGRPELADRQVSADGTVKWLIRFADGNLAETVLIPEDNRLTLCVSAQVGCTLNCRFCHTGTQKLVRNLTAAEIVGQIMIASDYVAAGAVQIAHGDVVISDLQVSHLPAGEVQQVMLRPTGLAAVQHFCDLQFSSTAGAGYRLQCFHNFHTLLAIRWPK